MTESGFKLGGSNSRFRFRQGAGPVDGQAAEFLSSELFGNSLERCSRLFFYGPRRLAGQLAPWPARSPAHNLEHAIQEQKVEGSGTTQMLRKMREKILSFLPSETTQ